MPDNLSSLDCVLPVILATIDRAKVIYEKAYEELTDQHEEIKSLLEAYGELENCARNIVSATRDIPPISVAITGLPDANPKTRYGVAKPGFDAIPASALIHLGQAMADGKKKYGLVNWRHDPVTMSVYFNAAMRHLWSFWDGEECDPKTEVHHLGYVMACCAIILDATEMHQMNDDRPKPGSFASMIEAMKKEINDDAAGSNT